MTHEEVIDNGEEEQLGCGHDEVLYPVRNDKEACGYVRGSNLLIRKTGIKNKDKTRYSLDWLSMFKILSDRYMGRHIYKAKIK